MNILGGRWKGRKLLAPEGAATRPTGARARQALSAGTALRYRLHGTITVDPTGRAYPIDYSSALSPVPGLDGVLR